MMPIRDKDCEGQRHVSIKRFGGHLFEQFMTSRIVIIYLSIDSYIIGASWSGKYPSYELFMVELRIGGVEPQNSNSSDF